jgi:hypothetical protein
MHLALPHPRPFSLGRREPEVLFPLLLGEGEGEGKSDGSYLDSATLTISHYAVYMRLAPFRVMAIRCDECPTEFPARLGFVLGCGQ